MNSSASTSSQTADAIDVEALTSALVETGLLADVRYVPETGSTNTDLLSEEKVADRTVLLTNSQTAGKGRLGRTWVAPEGSQLTFSLLVVPPKADILGLLPLVGGLAVTDAIPGTVLKWPNDVLIDGKKLCGILAEAGPLGGAFKSGKSAEYKSGKAEGEFKSGKAEGELAGEAHPDLRAVLGMGINVGMTREQLPVEHATSLALEGKETNRTQLAIDVLTALAKRLDQWESGDPQLMADYRAVCSSIGQEVRLEAPTGDVVGTVDAVADDGRIQVAGQLYSAGDVTHLRPAK
ncbi:biotin--[acetyl-CoA-carboxylase] ligase [Corynebacterium incognita]|uniref:biotin--[biotin carboxyl-carrier protein] ligase n=1 Tax=Corynebacterium incognita TaxID=2754725 RepID=A0A7G7CN85_9CORY|nr:biotin--[acetyl-CoA-carboxylase] ligase [Corynebacterium incognita]QNE89051.1 biotin--[acetyl-CoA-carboxylase] ligase [Corynebacterium incognita]